MNKLVRALIGGIGCKKIGWWRPCETMGRIHYNYYALGTCNYIPLKLVETWQIIIQAYKAVFPVTSKNFTFRKPSQSPVGEVRAIY